ncbi:hypothetical protein KQI84_14865 [bacterium]|nr:hypothetical protein [bacterium]
MKRELTLQILLVAAAVGLLLVVLLESRPVEVDTSTTLSPIVHADDTEPADDESPSDQPISNPEDETDYNPSAPGSETSFNPRGQTTSDARTLNPGTQLAQARPSGPGPRGNDRSDRPGAPDSSPDPAGRPPDQRPDGQAGAGPDGRQGSSAAPRPAPPGAAPAASDGATGESGESGDAAEGDDGPPVYWGAVPVPSGRGTRPKPTPSG